MKRKKIVLAAIAGICVMSLAVAGTLMLFSNISEVADNVVTLADDNMEFSLQEKGGTPVESENYADEDKDTFAEYSADYKDIGSIFDGTAFNGIEYPDLMPKTELAKNPRVFYKDGIDAYLRVLSKVNVYSKSSSGTWNQVTGADLSGLIAKKFKLVKEENGGNYKPMLLNDTEIEGFGDRIPAPDLLIKGRTEAEYFSVPDPNGANSLITYETFGQFLQAVLSGANTNQYNWEFKPYKANESSQASLTEGIYYYIENDFNPNLEKTADTYPLGLADYDYNIDNASNPLAVFGKDLQFTESADSDAATAPLFTKIIVPNFTDAMGEVLKDYRIAIQFEAQEVQIANNESGTWAQIFSELPSQIRTAAPNPLS
ncbi:MAG: hypothetical protein LBU32_00345 [Clostridiales bacterium]|jgi:hypothetical protein|nr:hypothetical protein [Clostridiales bacterium]